MPQAIDVVWFKRDLRLRDHLPLVQVQHNPRPVLLLYVFEPDVIADPHYSLRHWRFVYQSLQDLQLQLQDYATEIVIMHADIFTALTLIQSQFTIMHIYSHEEIGLDVTYRRDKALAQWCNNNANIDTDIQAGPNASIRWIEFPYSVVRRGLTHRKDWGRYWHEVIDLPCADADLSCIPFISRALLTELHAQTNTAIEQQQCLALDPQWQEVDKQLQLGGEKRAWHTYYSFLNKRGKNYAKHISSPSLSRHSCSRLSPYIAWGNITIKQTYQKLDSLALTEAYLSWRRAFTAMASRLHWHCHFIQKFESECAMEYRHLNIAYDAYPYESDPEVVSQRLSAWKTGMTGIPIVDANMRALIATGYINFRMRAMLVSVLAHHLNLDWRLGVHHMASLFLDFEPGIHYPQFQMQAGVTGTNTIRLYNPIKQSQERDPQGVFIKRWVHELAEFPDDMVHTPWLVSPMEQQLFALPSNNYPEPIVDIEACASAARDRLWAFKKRPEVKKDARRILNRHIVPGSR